MLLRATVVWLGLVCLAVLNGGAREKLLNPRLGERAGHVLSTLLLCLVIFTVAWAGVGWIGPQSAGEAFGVGAVWLVLTVAFEFLAGHYLFGNPWEKLLADYNVLKGRVWALVLVADCLAPLFAFLSKVS